MNQQERMAQENAGYQEVADDLYSEPGDVLSPEQARLLNEEPMIEKTLHQKLFDLQSEVGAIAKDSTNPFFQSKYFDVNSLLAHLQPLLQKHRLLLLQPIENGYVISRIVDCESGDSISSSMQLPTISDPQKMGSVITYYRRYTLQSLLALQAEDDDGNSASGHTNQVKNTPTKKPSVKKEDDDDRKWLNATNKEGELTKNGEYTAQKLYSGETTWDEVWKSVKVSKKDRAAVDKRVSEFDKDIDMDGLPFQ